jgi:hypothetical protein
MSLLYSKTFGEISGSDGDDYDDDCLRMMHSLVS